MHYDNGLLTEDDIAEVEALAQAYYDALDAEDNANAEDKANAEDNANAEENIKIGV